MSNKILVGIYVELDCLLDTRIGTIAYMGNELAESVLKSGYHTRMDDNFPGVDMEKYNELYEGRNTGTLSLSAPTNMIRLLRHLSGELTEQAIMRPYHDGAKVIINTHPYTLTAVEQEEIGKTVAVWMKGDVPVELVSIPPNSLTPAHCKSSYAMMIMYNGIEWMNIHSEAFNQTRLPEVLLFVPAIYSHKTPSEIELKKTIKEAAHPMKALEMLATPLVELRLIDVSYFSIIGA